MSGYRRFVAYVYEYQKGKKGSNCGFIKVEVREQRCTMEVHLHCVGLTPQVGCNVYGFVRKDGLMDGILLGSCETGEDTAECLIETDSLNMGGSGISLGRMGGMVLVTESGGFFGTEWDDQPIRPDNFREIQRKEGQTAQKTRIEKKKPDLTDEEEKEQGVKTIETAPSEKDQNVNNDAGMLADEGAAQQGEAESDIETDSDFSSGIGDDKETDVEDDTVAEMKEDTVNENSVAEESIQEQEENNRESGVSEDEAGEELQREGSDQESGTETEEEAVKERDETSRESAEPVCDVIYDEADKAVQEIKSSDTDIISQSMGGIEEETSILKNIQMVAENEKLLQEEQNVRIICPPDSNCGPGPRPPMPPNSGPGPRPPRPPMPPNPGPGPRPPMPPNSGPGPRPPRPPMPPNPGPGPRPPRPPMPPNPGPGPRPPMPPNPGPGPRPPMPPTPGPGPRPPRGMVKASIGEEFMPFDDGELTQCWKIHPKDFAYFQQRECSLRNNRFLLHGYYNFGHLLLGQKANGQYILGVPGGYDQQERFMANMFGFPYFKESSQIELPKGRGGYWYRLINAPNFH